MLEKKKVLILGGGFAGIETAISLAKERNIEVTLVSNRPYLYIFPISIWIPTNEIQFSDATLSLEKVGKRRGFKVIVDEVTEIIAKESLVKLSSNTELNYDYLVIAIGANKMQPKGIENTISICGNPSESLEIQKQLDLLIAKGKGSIAMGFGGNPQDTSAIRGGPAFELFFNVHNKLKNMGIRKNFELTFFAPMEKPGARMGGNSYEMMLKMFKMMNLKKRFGTKIKEFLPNKVVFVDDSTLETDLLIFVPANKGHKILVNSDLPISQAGFIEINEYCQVKGFENVYAVGDVAKLDGPDWRVKQGHIAEVMGRNVAQDIIIKINGLDTKRRESYIPHLNILCIMDTGNGAAFVYRDDKRAIMIPMPFIGHYMKKGWGLYTKLTKLGYFPRLPFL